MFLVAGGILILVKSLAPDALLCWLIHLLLPILVICLGFLLGNIGLLHHKSNTESGKYTSDSSSRLKHMTMSSKGGKGREEKIDLHHFPRHSRLEP